MKAGVAAWILALALLSICTGETAREVQNELEFGESGAGESSVRIGRQILRTTSRRRSRSHQSYSRYPSYGRTSSVKFSRRHSAHAQKVSPKVYDENYAPSVDRFPSDSTASSEQHVEKRMGDQAVADQRAAEGGSSDEATLNNDGFGVNSINREDTSTNEIDRSGGGDQLDSADKSVESQDNEKTEERMDTDTATGASPDKVALDGSTASIDENKADDNVDDASNTDDSANVQGETGDTPQSDQNQGNSPGIDVDVVSNGREMEVPEDMRSPQDDRGQPDERASVDVDNKLDDRTESKSGDTSTANTMENVDDDKTEDNAIGMTDGGGEDGNSNGAANDAVPEQNDNQEPAEAAGEDSSVADKNNADETGENEQDNDKSGIDDRDDTRQEDDMLVKSDAQRPDDDSTPQQGEESSEKGRAYGFNADKDGGDADKGDDDADKGDDNADKGDDDADKDGDDSDKDGDGGADKDGDNDNNGDDDNDGGDDDRRIRVDDVDDNQEPAVDDVSSEDEESALTDEGLVEPSPTEIRVRPETMTIDVYGENFTNEQNLLCKYINLQNSFETIVRGRYISPTFIVCPIPPLEQNPADKNMIVKVSNNGHKFSKGVDVDLSVAYATNIWSFWMKFAKNLMVTIIGLISALLAAVFLRRRVKRARDSRSRLPQTSAVKSKMLNTGGVRLRHRVNSEAENAENDVEAGMTAANAADSNEEDKSA
mmetsp:Transcript_7713/g.23347  ORF Transcript_7713/g.23347 Transcript_7713/m.23347 type:complete len:714 (-) Transcript_7713:3209-5350(-)|eukprot:CAMPEP_0198737282 /NCGR_PEP_ID=MMETSP1475-20131203/67786_1 /TAXON_ID= ORGANISM="Unidentified sp., Strain CCMP1999" /NCGR_SAMPLE_ID=MMETSP1475 /ASSEMBLY_ACC=CAM_ASM_001111 /LENGTH=713 /DNA_ID=CAMNT_0044501141 /DNA_START=116 /DNA_END=2257 /DNA_ORIENTATION=-